MRHFLIILFVLQFFNITTAQWAFVDESTSKKQMRTAQIASFEDPNVHFGLAYYQDSWEWITKIEDQSGVQFSFDSKLFSETWFKVEPSPKFNYIDELALSDDFLAKIFSENTLKIVAIKFDVKKEYTFELSGSRGAIEEAIEGDSFDFMDLVIKKKNSSLPSSTPDVFIDEIFKVVETMPLFGDCTTKACSDEALIKYIQGNIKYPSDARFNGIEGRVFIRFVVEKDGSVTGAQILRDIGAGCGEEALRIIEEMNYHPIGWTSGRQRGKPVRVLYTLPATFTLETEN